MFSQRSNVIKYALAVVFCCPLIAVHIPTMNTIVAGQCIMTGVYSLIFAIYQMFIAGIFPPVTMIIFSCLAYFNMRKGGIRDENSVSRTKRQLIRMVTTQITVYIISAELVHITTLYKQLTANVIGKSRNQKAIESFITFIASNFLLYLNTWAPFFIYYATSSSFRTAFIRMFKKNYRIQPAITIIGRNIGSTTGKY
jgi:heme/copper-type cytochrome/quinol oxidase subunit 2